MLDTTDPEIANVAAELRRLDPDGARFARVLRLTYDQIYDGKHTGRFRWEQLSKIEKTHFGSLVAINLQREFSFDDGVDRDCQIAGVDFECKWQETRNEWVASSELIGQICLVVSASDEHSVWSAGLTRGAESPLSISHDPDDKVIPNVPDRATIHWIWTNESLPENVLLHINSTVLRSVTVDLAGPRRKQKRLDELFRRVPNRIIGGGVIATIAQQDGHKKRLRAIRRSRQNLKSEGFVVFGDSPSHRIMTFRLGLPSIGDDDSMSARLIQINGPNEAAVNLGGSWYGLCPEGGEPTKPAPALTARSSA